MEPMDRRHLMKLLGGGAAAAVVLAACGSSSKPSSSATTTPSTSGSTDTTATTSSCTQIPEETAGPFPGDGSNGPDVLSMDGVVRKDITKSIGDASGTADGVNRRLFNQVVVAILRAYRRAGSAPTTAHAYYY